MPSGSGYLADRPVDLLSFPCRRRKAFRIKDRPEGLISSPEDEELADDEVLVSPAKATLDSANTSNHVVGSAFSS